VIGETFLTTLLVSAAAIAILLLATFAVALRVGRYNVVDAVWGLGFALIAVVAFAMSAGDGSTPRRAALLAATVVWGMRLASYIGWRSRGAGEDPRYAEMLDKAPRSRAAYALRKVFLLQAGLIWLISVPVQAGMFERGGPGWLVYGGLAVWACGLAFEGIGDWQLARFKADPASRGTVMDRGLWRYTRHPNYFGDACVWWGLFLISCGSWLGLLTIYAPVLMTFLLAAGSGKPITEERLSARPGYAEYVRRTSGFVPLPPRRRVAPTR
jgi:steroid 5-alpha reductase family enzyme